MSSTVLALGLLLIGAGCSESPVSEFDGGKAMLEEAKLAQAEQYAPELFARAKDSLGAAEADMVKQDGRFAPFRDYDRSRELIAAVNVLAQQALDTAKVRQEQMRQLDSSLVIEIDSLIAAARASLASAPRGKGSAIDLKMMQSDVDAAVSALASAKEEVAARNYLTARDRLLAIKSQVSKVRDDVAAASTRTSNK